ncbi:unnamed protein product, partial [Staurois parvus]
LLLFSDIAWIIYSLTVSQEEGRTDHLKTRSVGGPMRCPWYLFYRLF